MKSLGEVRQAIAVVAIVSAVGLIGAVFVPASTSPEPMIEKECVKNLSQAGLSVLMYSADHDDRLPFSDRWITDTRVYFKTPPHCPATPPGSVGYAMNDAVSTAPFPAESLASQRVMLFESSEVRPNAHGSLPEFSWGRHHEGSYVAYVDGHLEAIR